MTSRYATDQPAPQSSILDLAGGAMAVYKVALNSDDMSQGFACPTLCDPAGDVLQPDGSF